MGAGSAQLWARGASGGERSPARESKVYGSGLGRRGHTSNVCAERGATENVSTECPVRLRVLEVRRSRAVKVKKGATLQTRGILRGQHIPMSNVCAANADARQNRERCAGAERDVSPAHAPGAPHTGVTAFYVVVAGRTSAERALCSRRRRVSSDATCADHCVDRVAVALLAFYPARRLVRERL